MGGKIFRYFNKLKMKSPKVAIIICTYNQDVLLRKCLSSLKNKTDYKNYRVFFVDDSGKGKIGNRRLWY